MDELFLDRVTEIATLHPNLDCKRRSKNNINLLIRIITQFNLVTKYDVSKVYVKRE